MPWHLCVSRVAFVWHAQNSSSVLNSNDLSVSSWIYLPFYSDSPFPPIRFTVKAALKKTRQFCTSVGTNTDVISPCDESANRADLPCCQAVASLSGGLSPGPSSQLYKDALKWRTHAGSTLWLTQRVCVVLVSLTVPERLPCLPMRHFLPEFFKFCGHLWWQGYCFPVDLWGLSLMDDNSLPRMIQVFSPRRIVTMHFGAISAERSSPWRQNWFCQFW